MHTGTKPHNNYKRVHVATHFLTEAHRYTKHLNILPHSYNAQFPSALFMETTGGRTGVRFSGDSEVGKLGIHLMWMNSSVNTCLFSDTCQGKMAHPSHSYTAWNYTHTYTHLSFEINKGAKPD